MNEQIIFDDLVCLDEFDEPFECDDIPFLYTGSDLYTFFSAFTCTEKTLGDTREILNNLSYSVNKYADEFTDEEKADLKSFLKLFIFLLSDTDILILGRRNPRQLASVIRTLNSCLTGPDSMIALADNNLKCYELTKFAECMSGRSEDCLKALVHRYLQNEADYYREFGIKDLSDYSMNERRIIVTHIRTLAICEVREELMDMGIAVTGPETADSIDELEKWLLENPVDAPSSGGDGRAVRSLTAKLSMHIAGQDEQVRKVAAFAYNHVLRLKLRRQGVLTTDTAMRTACLLIGPTGSGKSATMRALEKVLPPSVGVAYVDCSWLSPEGYKDTSFSFVMEEEARRLRNAGKSLNDSILFCDEFDKCLGARGDGSNVQDLFLTLIEGNGCLTIGDSQSSVTLDTRGMSIVLAGAFSGVLGSEKRICGFARESAAPGGQIRQRLCEVMKPELAGRLLPIIQYNKIDRPTLRAIISRDPYPAVTAAVNAIGSRISITEDGIEYLLDYLENGDFGVRGLETVYASLYYELLAQGAYDRTLEVDAGKLQRFL